MSTAIGNLGVGTGRETPAAPLVWRHPHVRGACVVEDLDGTLWLLFEREDCSAWTHRRRWTNGVAMLLPYGQDAGDVLTRLGYANEAPWRAPSTPSIGV